MAGINFDALTLDEVELVEELTGQTLDELVGGGKVPGAKAIRAFGLIVLRRTEPATTIEQVGKLAYVDVINLISDSEVSSDGPKANPAKRATHAKPAPNSKPL